jgi:hypothetical protein
MEGQLQLLRSELVDRAQDGEAVLRLQEVIFHYQVCSPNRILCNVDEDNRWHDKRQSAIDHSTGLLVPPFTSEQMN